MVISCYAGFAWCQVKFSHFVNADFPHSGVLTDIHSDSHQKSTPTWLLIVRLWIKTFLLVPLHEWDFFFPSNLFRVVHLSAEIFFFYFYFFRDFLIFFHRTDYLYTDTPTIVQAVNVHVLRGRSSCIVLIQTNLTSLPEVSGFLAWILPSVRSLGVHITLSVPVQISAEVQMFSGGK